MKANIIRRTARMAATGTMGVLVVEGARTLARRGTPRQGAVVATAWALRGKRRAEVGAESLRLSGADIVSEARARVGEQSPVPGEAAAHDHQH